MKIAATRWVSRALVDSNDPDCEFFGKSQIQARETRCRVRSQAPAHSKDPDCESSRRSRDPHATRWRTLREHESPVRILTVNSSGEASIPLGRVAGSALKCPRSLTANVRGEIETTARRVAGPFASTSRQ